MNPAGRRTWLGSYLDRVDPDHRFHEAPLPTVSGVERLRADVTRLTAERDDARRHLAILADRDAHHRDVVDGLEREITALTDQVHALRQRETQ